jgi:hypothetical protein
MAIGDIGYFIFYEVLGISQYPNSPFSGNIVIDLIMRLFLPTVLVIMFIYALLGFIHLRNAKLRVLMGIAFYLFIVAGGYFSFFVLMSDFYFILLIFVVGLIFFLPSHFGYKRQNEAGGGAHNLPASAVSGGAATASHAEAAASLLNAIQVQCGVVEATKEGPDQRELPNRINELGNFVKEFRDMKSAMKLNPGERAKFAALLTMHGASEKAIMDQADKLLKMKH